MGRSERYTKSKLRQIRSLRASYLGSARWGLSTFLFGATLSTFSTVFVADYARNFSCAICWDYDHAPAVGTLQAFGISCLVASAVLTIRYIVIKDRYLSARRNLKVTAGSQGLNITFTDP